MKQTVVWECSFSVHVKLFITSGNCSVLVFHLRATLSQRYQVSTLITGGKNATNGTAASDGRVGNLYVYEGQRLKHISVDMQNGKYSVKLEIL